MDIREPARVSSSQPPGLMMGPPNPYGALAAVSTPGNNSMVPSSAAGMIQGMRLSFNNVPASTIPNPTVDNTGSPFHESGVSSMKEPDFLNNIGEQMKKKRGRPRKYGPDGSMAIALSPLSSSSGYTNSPISDPASKRRGRPPGSGKKKQLEALGSPGSAFTPHASARAALVPASACFARRLLPSRGSCRRRRRSSPVHLRIWSPHPRRLLLSQKAHKGLAARGVHYLHRPGPAL